MARLYKINAEEISKLVSETKKGRVSKKTRLVNSTLPPKKIPKVEKIPLIRTEAEVSMPSPKPSEDVVSEPVPEPEPIPRFRCGQENAPEPVPEPVIEEVEETLEEAEDAMEVDEEPPKWFTKFCLQVKEEQERQNREEGERKVPQRVIKEEAEQFAQERWQDPRIRERVESKINTNLKSIYSMVFPNRHY